MKKKPLSQKSGFFYVLKLCREVVLEAIHQLKDQLVFGDLIVAGAISRINLTHDVGSPKFFLRASL
jgi:hypothetical protein